MNDERPPRAGQPSPFIHIDLSPYKTEEKEKSRIHWQLTHWVEEAYMGDTLDGCSCLT